MPNLRILGDNFSIFKCYSSKAGPEMLFFRKPAKNDGKIKPEEEHCCSYYPSRWLFEKTN